MSIHIGEENRYGGKPLYMALLEYLRREGAAGATVVRGIAGFGARSRIHTASIVTLSTDLPITLVWVDLEERVERLMPQVRRMVDEGLITLERVDVVQYAAGRWPDPLAQPVRNVMRKEVVTLTPLTTLEQATALIVEKGYRSLPVVDERGRVVGIMTGGDLLRHTQLNARLAQRAGLSTAEIRSELLALQSSARLVADVMTKPVITARVDEDVRSVGLRMMERGIKRLPVVNSAGEIAGIISRMDVLRVAEHHAVTIESYRREPHSGSTIADLMYSNVSTVAEDAPLEEIVQAMETSKQQRVIVVDEDRRVVGIITDGDLLDRSKQADEPDLRTRLWNLFSHPSRPTRILPDSGETATHLMSTPAQTISAVALLEDALQLMLSGRFKQLPVVDAQGRLLGLLGRASVLHGFLERGDETNQVARG